MCRKRFLKKKKYFNSAWLVEFKVRSKDRFLSPPPPKTPYKAAYALFDFLKSLK